MTNELTQKINGMSITELQKQLSYLLTKPKGREELIAYIEHKLEVRTSDYMVHSCNEQGE